jgi:hypothetical protein
MSMDMDLYWEEMGGKVLGELNRRLDSGEGKDLPGTLLMRLAELYLKRLEKLAAEADEEVEYLTPLQAIDQEGLPIESKIEILSGYVEQLKTDLSAATARLEELTSDTAQVQ